jgi:hypothetical protein
VPLKQRPESREQRAESHTGVMSDSEDDLIDALNDDKVVVVVVVVEIVQ